MSYTPPPANCWQKLSKKVSKIFEITVVYILLQSLEPYVDPTFTELMVELIKLL